MQQEVIGQFWNADVKSTDWISGKDAKGDTLKPGPLIKRAEIWGDVVQLREDQSGCKNITEYTIKLGSTTKECLGFC